MRRRMLNSEDTGLLLVRFFSLLFSHDDYRKSALKLYFQVVADFCETHGYKPYAEVIVLNAIKHGRAFDLEPEDFSDLTLDMLQERLCSYTAKKAQPKPKVFEPRENNSVERFVREALSGNFLDQNPELYRYAIGAMLQDLPLLNTRVQPLPVFFWMSIQAHPRKEFILRLTDSLVNPLSRYHRESNEELSAPGLFLEFGDQALTLLELASEDAFRALLRGNPQQIHNIEHLFMNIASVADPLLERLKAIYGLSAELNKERFISSILKMLRALSLEQVALEDILKYLELDEAQKARPLRFVLINLMLAVFAKLKMPLAYEVVAQHEDVNLIEWALALGAVFRPLSRKDELMLKTLIISGLQGDFNLGALKFLTQHNQKIAKILRAQGVDLDCALSYPKVQELALFETAEAQSLSLAAEQLLQVWQRLGEFVQAVPKDDEALPSQLKAICRSHQALAAIIVAKTATAHQHEELSAVVVRVLMTDLGRSHLAKIARNCRALGTEALKNVALALEPNLDLPPELQENLGAYQKFNFRLFQWGKVDAKTLFLGHLMRCCLSPEGSKFMGMVHRVCDDAAQIHVAVNERTGDVMAVVWLCFVSIEATSKLALLANFFELRNSIEKMPWLTQQLIEHLSQFVDQYAKDCGVERCYFAELTYGTQTGFFRRNSSFALPNPQPRFSKVGGNISEGDSDWHGCAFDSLDGNRPFYAFSRSTS